MFQEDQQFSGDFSYEKQKSSVSKELLHLVSLILDDNSPSRETDHCTQSEVIKLNLSQLIQYNSVKKKRQSSGPVRHSKVNEPPLPVKIGLLIHASTRKKSLVNKFAKDGLSISYNRVEEIQNNITKYLCTKYNKENIVCPPQLQNGCFTITAIDNIDHNPSSTTAHSSFHGTTISVFQKTQKKVEKTNINLDEGDEEYKTLPEYYTNIYPVKGGKHEFPSDNKIVRFYTHDERISLEAASEWLNSNEVSTNTSFSSFYSKNVPNSFNEPDVNVLLPILNESVNSPAVVHHCMKLVAKLTDHLNPDQTSVLIADQPVFTIAK